MAKRVSKELRLNILTDVAFGMTHEATAKKYGLARPTITKMVNDDDALQQITHIRADARRRTIEGVVENTLAAQRTIRLSYDALSDALTKRADLTDEELDRLERLVRIVINPQSSAKIGGHDTAKTEAADNGGKSDERNNVDDAFVKEVLNGYNA